MSSNDLSTSQSSDDLTQSQLDAVYLSDEDETDNVKFPDIKEELQRIAIAVETACKEHQKLGEAMIQEVREITVHVKTAAFNDFVRARNRAEIDANRNWTDRISLILHGSLIITAIWALLRMR